MAREDVYRPNFAAFAEMAIGDEIRAAVLAEAERGRVIAEGLAADITKSGVYEASFNTLTKIVPMDTAAGVHMVVAGELANDAPHAAAVEWGNARDHRPHHILSRTLGFLEHG